MKNKKMIGTFDTPTCKIILYDNCPISVYLSEKCKQVISLKKENAALKQEVYKQGIRLKFNR